jgi:ABC-type polysaccharide/polyol phosphate transport system ATPase subunit
VITPALVPPPIDDLWLERMHAVLSRPPVVEIHGLGVRYGTSPGERGMSSLVSVALRRPPRREVWALRDVDLTVHAGECLGIIGPNGAGKSTLLRVMAKLIDHDAGSVSVRGRISALLNLGVGFDPLLTGRENVQLVGSLMGLNRSETRRRLPGVIEFADIGDFIDAPLLTYSSGMRARLGFAAAAEMVEPHVLLLDEVMGTGDAAFRERSRERVMELVQHAHAVVVASHDMTWVSEFATYAMLLDGGSLIAEGAPSGVTTLHRARAVKPPRRYGCPQCEGYSFEITCPRCGVRRRRTPETAVDPTR